MACGLAVLFCLFPTCCSSFLCPVLLFVVFSFIGRSVRVAMSVGGVGANPATASGRVALGAPVPGAPIMFMCLVGFGRRVGEPRGALGWLVWLVVVLAEFSGDGVENGGGCFRVFLYAGL